MKALEMLSDRCITIDTSCCCFPDDLGQLMAAPAWKDPDMEAAKERLNEVKSRLDSMKDK